MPSDNNSSDSSSGSKDAAATVAPSPSPVPPGAIGSIQPGISPPGSGPLPFGGGLQIPQAMLGIQLGQPQQNPEVMQQICTYLSHDSDNRLKWFEGKDRRTHFFRMSLLFLFAVVVLLMLAIPMVSLWRGDIAFVKEFLDRYFNVFILIVLALLGGGKLADLFK